MSTANLVRWGGIASMMAAVSLSIGSILRMAGLLYVGQSIFFTGYVLLVFGIMGVYLVQAERTGTLGFVAFVMTMIGTALSIVPAALLLAANMGFQEIHYAQAFFSMKIPLTLVAILIGPLGTLLLGVATARGGVLSRWTGILMIAGSVFNLVYSLSYFTPVGVAGVQVSALAFLLAGWEVVTGAGLAKSTAA
ncbi:MAG: hypothetical protein ACOY94_10580 [Bacillota bacterium]